MPFRNKLRDVEPWQNQVTNSNGMDISTYPQWVKDLFADGILIFRQDFSQPTTIEDGSVIFPVTTIMMYREEEFVLGYNGVVVLYPTGEKIPYTIDDYIFGFEEYGNEI